MTLVAVLLVAVLETLLLPHAFGPVWVLGQTAIVVGSVLGWVLHRRTDHLQTIRQRCGDAAVEPESGSPTPYRTAA